MIKERLKAFGKVSEAPGQRAWPLLFSGGAGLGKSTLAHLYAIEHGKAFKSKDASEFALPVDFAGALIHIEEGDVLLLENIHMINAIVEPMLLDLMRSSTLMVTVNHNEAIQGAAKADVIKLKLPPFTLIGSVSDASRISPRLLEEFLMTCHFAPYTPQEIAQLLTHQIRQGEPRLDEEAALEIGKHSEGVPAKAFKMAEWVETYCAANSHGTLDKRSTIEALRVLGYESENSFTQ